MITPRDVPPELPMDHLPSINEPPGSDVLPDDVQKTAPTPTPAAAPTAAPPPEPGHHDDDDDNGDDDDDDEDDDKPAAHRPHRGTPTRTLPGRRKAR